MALESVRLPLAIIIKGNPKYLHDPKVALIAQAYYRQIKSLLESRGYRVEFNSGAPRTIPKTSAVLWVAHSRGIDRLQYAPAGVKTLQLQPPVADGADQASRDACGLNPDHYKLSEIDIKNLSSI